MHTFIASIEEQEALLSPDESLHCAKVLRMKAGDKIQLIDGKGHYFEATLEQVNDKRCKAKITSPPRIQIPRPYKLHLAIAPTKQIDRMEWMLEKAVEIGIDEVTWIRCKNSERKVVNSERLQKIVESAVKQSQQARLPRLNPMTEFKKIVELTSTGQRWIAYCGAAPKTPIFEVQFVNRESLVLVGPEGDFSEDENKLALSFGFQNISLGENRLRTETAGLFVTQAALFST